MIIFLLISSDTSKNTITGKNRNIRVSSRTWQIDVIKPVRRLLYLEHTQKEQFVIGSDLTKKKKEMGKKEIDKILFSHSSMGSAKKRRQTRARLLPPHSRKTQTRANELVTEAALGDVRSLVEHPTIRT